MAEIEETCLPGVGGRHGFITASGVRIGLLSHLSGHRELLVYSRDDPDACRDLIELDDEDVRVLAELMGADHVTEHLHSPRQSMHGMTIDWLELEESWRHASSRLEELRLADRSPW